jgi:hypothetical protein
MATVVQSKTGSGTGSSTYTITLDSAATNGNDIIYVGISDTQVHSGACTFGGANMTTDLSTEFGLWRIARFRVTAAGTDCVVTLGGTSNWRGIILEMSGFTSSPLEATIVKTATGEGSATSHSCEYASGTAGRWGIVGIPGGVNRTFTGANGASALAINAQNAVVYKDALGSSAGSIDFTVDIATAYDFFAATYLTASASAAGPLVGGRLLNGPFGRLVQ